MFFKKLVAILIGVAGSFLVGMLVTLMLASQIPLGVILGSLVVVTTIGSLIILGGYIAVSFGREICERVFGWFF